VLTNGPYFQGDPAHLKAARAASKLPVLRKDFMLDPWQIYESRAMGADCVLIIMAAVTNQQAIELEGVARMLEMDVLVEVHNHHELDRALGLQTPLVGVNNRDLKTLQTDLGVTEELASFVPPDRLLITESGIRTPEDVHRMGEVGAQCLLVGESLLRQPDIEAAVHNLLGTCAT
jgi:indole-3-glycerol phosphate synthase